MDLDSIGLIVPIIAVLFFLLLEKNNNREINIFDGRGKSILTIELVSLLLSLILASVLLLPLVMSISNLQIFSMSQLQLPTYVTFALSFLLIDFINYINHRVHHKIPFLWRFHRLHHSDKKINALTTWLMKLFDKTGHRPGYGYLGRNILKNWRSWSKAPALYPQIKSPVTLIYGENDWSRVEERMQTLNKVPNAKLEAIANSGHFLSVDNPNALKPLFQKAIK